MRPLFTIARQCLLHQVLVGPSKQLKQIIQTEHNIYKRDRGFELGATEKQIQAVVRAGIEPKTAGM